MLSKYTQCANAVIHHIPDAGGRVYTQHPANNLKR
jgi:hypothetical protein